MLARGLDHVAHAVSDLAAVAALYTRAGFTVGAHNVHAPAWGTQNHIVQLPGFFVELLAMADVSAIAPHADRYFSFGAFNRDFLERGQGLSMLVLEGNDSAAEAEAFRAVGIGDFGLFNFERGAKRPDGTPTKVAFSLAFARDRKAPDIGYFTCKQLYPENFWNPAFQQHANSAIGIAGVVLVADNPGEHHAFLSAFTGERDVRNDRNGYFSEDSTRRNPGHGPGVVCAPFRRLAAWHATRRAACGIALCGARHGGGPGGSCRPGKSTLPSRRSGLCWAPTLPLAQRSCLKARVDPARCRDHVRPEGR